MSGEVAAGICVGAILIVTAIIALIWFYRKHSNVEPEGKIHLKRKRSTESYDYILLDKNAFDRITIEHNPRDYRPVKQLKTSNDKYNCYRFTDKPVFNELQSKEIPVSATKHYPALKYKAGHDYLYKDGHMYDPCSKRSCDNLDLRTVEAGDRRRTSKHTCRDGKYKHYRETISEPKRNSIYEDIEKSSHFTTPMKKHLTKVRTVRRPSLHSRKQEDQVNILDEYETSYNTGLLPNDNNVVSDKHTNTESDTKTARRSVKEIVDDVKNVTNSKPEKTTRTVMLTNEDFGRVNALREKYNKTYDNQESAIQNLNMSGKERRNQGSDGNTLTQNKSDISTDRDRGKATDRLLRRNTMSDLYDESAKNDETYQYQVSKVRGDRYLESSVQNELNSDIRGFRISNKTVGTPETRTNEAICYPSKANSEIKPTVTKDISSFPTSKHLPLTSSIPANGEKTSSFVVSKSPIFKTVLYQVDIANGINGDVSSLTKTASVDTTHRKLQSNPTLPIIRNSPSSKLQQPKLNTSSQTCDQSNMSIDKSFDNNSTPKLSAPLLVSPVKPRPPVAPKPKTPRRKNTSNRNHISDSKQNGNSIGSPEVLKKEYNLKSSAEQFTAISPVIQTIQPKCLPPIEKSPVHHVVGLSHIPIISDVSLGSETVTTQVGNQDIDNDEDILRAEESRNTQINVDGQNDDSSTKNTRHVNFRSPVLCDIVLRTPSPDEQSVPSPTDSMMEQCGTGEIELENDSTDSYNTDTQQAKLQFPNFETTEIQNASLNKEGVQNSLNQTEQIKIDMNDKVGQSVKLPSKVHLCDQNVTESPEISFDSKNALPSTRGENEQTGNESHTEENEPSPLTNESQQKIDNINGHQNNCIVNTSGVFKAAGSNLESGENQTSDNNDEKVETQVNSESSLEETIEEKSDCVTSNHRQGLPDTNFESFNPNSSSTPLQSHTDIDTKFKDDLDLDEGEATFAMVQEALAKRRKRFVNESIGSPSEELQDQSSMWHDDTCNRNEELSNAETDNNNALCYLEDN